MRVGSGYEALLFLPDQSVCCSQGYELVKSTAWTSAFIGGPPTYNPKVKEIRLMIDTMRRALGEICRRGNVVLAHHLLRDPNWKSYVPGECNAVTYAEYLRLSPTLLEARRRELYEHESPGEHYLKIFKGKSIVRFERKT